MHPTPRPSSAGLEPWERKSVDFLEKHLDGSTLRALVGELESAIRTHRRAGTGVDRPSTKRQLAAALVVQRSRDLLADARLRKALGAVQGIKPPRRWHPGKAAARAFVHACGLPPELAGEVAAERPSDEEDIDPPPSLRSLEDFQEEVQEEILGILGRPRGRSLLTLPTGAGKTRVAVDSLRRHLLRRDRGSIVVWLAHSEELCEQAISCFREVWQGAGAARPIRLIRFWGSFSRNIEGPGEFPVDGDRDRIVVSTPVRFHNELVGTVGRAAATGPLHEAIRERLDTVVIDEAHGAAAPTYQRIVSAIERWNPESRLLGLTATPFRKELGADGFFEGAARLREIFATLVEPRATLGAEGLQELQRRGVLARPRVRSLRTKTILPDALRGRSSTALLFEDLMDIDRELSRIADQPQRRREVLPALLDAARAPGSSVLYFGPSVGDAAAMAYLLRANGVPAGFVSGETSRATRRSLVEEFRSGRLRVLCNCEVLTTGFDAPRITHVVIARPTVSPVLYQQMVGRGLRGPRFGGTSEVTLIDCEDNRKNPSLTMGYEVFRAAWRPLHEGLDRSHGAREEVGIRTSARRRGPPAPLEPIDRVRSTLESRARAGEAEAMWLLAQQFYRGGPTAAREDLCFFWLHRAAVLGHTAAMYDLALCLERGIGHEADSNAALEWLRRAHAQGHRRAREAYRRVAGTRKLAA